MQINGTKRKSPFRYMLQMFGYSFMRLSVTIKLDIATNIVGDKFLDLQGLAFIVSIELKIKCCQLEMTIPCDCIKNVMVDMEEASSGVVFSRVIRIRLDHALLIL